MPTIQVNGVTLAYTDTGPPPSRPGAATVVFGHGTLFGGWMFHHQIEALRDRYRCVALDWRGHGQTPATRDGYDIDTLTADAAAVVEALELGRVHWVGLSTGGFVGQRLAARHGSLLRSLVLLGTAAETESRRAIRRYRLLTAVYRLTGPTVIAPAVATVMFGPEFRADPQGRTVIEDWTRRLGRARRGGIVKAVRAVMNRDSVDAELAAITVPTLVVVGSDDRATPPRRARRMAALIPGARVVEIPQCGHCSTLEKPAAISDVIAAFLADAAEPPPATPGNDRSPGTGLIG